FRIRAYQRAAQTLETLTEDLATVAARGQLQKLPAIGKDLAGRIDEYLKTGSMAQLDRLRAEFPAGLLTLLEVQGLGPRTAKLLYEQAGVDSIERLEALCRDQQIIGVAGIKQKTCENILKS